METISRSQIEAQQREKETAISRGQQLYAKIKRSSKYYGQTDKGERFKVFVEAGHPDAYVVQGGPGGQYRLADVSLFVVEDGRELRIS